MNVTIANYEAGSGGFITAYPGGSARPFVSTVNFGTGPPVANAAIIAAGAVSDPEPRFGVIDVYSSGPTHLILDINGYFAAPTVNGDLSIEVVGTKQGALIFARNRWGGTGSVGINGVAVGTPDSFGVQGSTAGLDYESAGVLGFTWARSNTIDSWERAGVRGESGSGGSAVGVLGLSAFIGVSGVNVNSAGAQVASGVLGYGGYGVYAFGNMGASGGKFFVEPHPTDATKVIRYVSLEGPEAGTYFRGRGRIVDGRAVIDVPESFRMVSEEEGLTVHLTAMGPEVRALTVTAAALDGITVASSGDGAFFYIVHGVRKGYKDFEAIAEGTEFVPRNQAGRLPLHLNDSQKQRLIENGTYNNDGTVNLSTAVKLGWAKAWVENAASVSAPGPAVKRDN